jgi:hypothetical protein
MDYTNTELMSQEEKYKMFTPDQNNLSQLNFRFKLSITPELEYRAQNVIIPGINLGAISSPTPFVPYFNAGNITYDELSIKFIVGEKMADYLEIFNWMTNLGHPDNFEQYKNTKADCSVYILSNNLQPQIHVRFTDVFPTSLSPIEFDSTLPEIQYATSTVNFRFNRYYFDVLA